MVTLKLNLTLIDITGKKEIKLNLENSRTLLDILDEIGLPHDEIGKFNFSRLYFIFC